MPVKYGILTPNRVLNRQNLFNFGVLDGFVVHRFTFHWSPSSNQCCSDLRWPSLLSRRNFSLLYLFMIFWTNTIAWILKNILLCLLLLSDHMRLLYLVNSHHLIIIDILVVNSVFHWSCIPYSVVFYLTIMYLNPNCIRICVNGFFICVCFYLVLLLTRVHHCSDRLMFYAA